ncbi:MAG: carbonic anhydrase [Nitrospirota bacterium]
MLSRRELLKGFGVMAVALATSQVKDMLAWAGGHGESKKLVSPDEAIKLLKEGNERFISMKRKSDPGVGPEIRQTLTMGQWPYATILCCADSRVPPELIFDEGLGRLFVVRVAGNVINPALLGSMEYISLHSTSRLILVLGHESCGAVAATVKVLEYPHMKETPCIEDIMNRLKPAVLKAKETGAKGKELVEASSKENVRMVVKQIAKESKALGDMQKKGELKIVGGYYYLGSGKVEIWG